MRSAGDHSRLKDPSLDQSHCFNTTAQGFCAEEDAVEDGTFRNCGVWEIHYFSGKHWNPVNGSRAWVWKPALQKSHLIGMNGSPKSESKQLKWKSKGMNKDGGVKRYNLALPAEKEKDVMRFLCCFSNYIMFSGSLLLLQTYSSYNNSDLSSVIEKEWSFMVCSANPFVSDL